MNAAQANNAREARGRELARRVKIQPMGDRYVVPSATQSATTYIVDLVEASCTCPDYELHRVRCKHQEAVLYQIAWSQTVDEAGVVSETLAVKKKTYPQNWRAYNRAQRNEQADVARLLKSLCASVPEPPRTPGRGRKRKPLADQAFAAIMKVFTTFSARRASTAIRECSERDLLDDMHYNTVLKFFERSESTAILTNLVELSAAPLAAVETAGQFAIDSSGFSTVQYDRWFDQKHGKLRATHPWVKLHIVCGTLTNVIAAARVSPEGDCPLLPALVEQASKNFKVAEISADKAYLSVENLETMAKKNIAAFIPFKTNSIANPKSAEWNVQLARFVLNASVWWQKYHRRSNSESTFHMVKTKFGAAVRSRLPVAQINEVLAKCVAHNLVCVAQALYEHGIEPAWSPEPERRVGLVPLPTDKVMP